MEQNKAVHNIHMSVGPLQSRSDCGYCVQVYEVEFETSGELPEVFF